MIMDRSIDWYLFAVLLLPLTLHAQLPSTSADDYPPIVPFDLGTDPAFADYRKAIGDYVHLKPGYHAEICIIGEHDPMDGHAKGESIGHAKGKAEGRAEGEHTASLRIARSLLAMLDDAAIAATTGLDVVEVTALRGR
jgi:hypothetical protein